MLENLKRHVFSMLAIVMVALVMLFIIQPAAMAAGREAAQDEDPAVQAVAQAIQTAANWLIETHRNADGGFTSFSAGADQAPSDIAGTLDALWALGIAGADVAPSISYLEDNAAELADYVAQDGSTAGKAVLGLLGAEQDVSNFAGLNLLATLDEHLTPAGHYGVETAFNQSLAMLAAAFSGATIDEASVTWLIDLQETEGDLAGSWDDGFGTAGNADSTALAIAALRVSGLTEDDPAISAGRDFLARAQLDSGGWEYGEGFGESANSTALVLLALTFLGEDIAAEDGQWAQDGQTPLEALLAWQGESGAFQLDLGDGRFDDFFSTAQTLPALAFSQMLLGRPPIQVTAETLPEEMTPTATPTTAVEPTVTEESVEPTPTEEPTEAPPTVTATAAVETEGDAADAEAGAADEVQAADDEAGTSIWPWILGVGGIVALGLLAWRLIARRQEG